MNPDTKSRIKHYDEKLAKLWTQYSYLDKELDNNKNLTKEEQQNIFKKLVELANKTARSTKKRNSLIGGKTKRRNTNKKQRKTKNRKSS